MARSDFGKAFSAARASGLAVFDFQGKKYHTKTKEEMEAAVKAAKPAESPTPAKPAAAAAAAAEAPQAPSMDAPNTEENVTKIGNTTRITLDPFQREARGYEPTTSQPATRATGANDGAAANVSKAGPTGPRSASREVKRGKPITFGALARRDERGYNK